MSVSDQRLQKTTWNDLSNAGFGKSKVRQQYKEAFGIYPDDVHVNEGICVEYDHYCYNHLGSVHTGAKGTTVVSDVKASRELENDTDEEITHEVSLSTQFSSSATLTVTNSSEFSFTAGITVGSKELGLEASFSESFAFKNEVGSSSTQSRSTTISDKVIVTVPPHSKKHIELVVTWRKMSADFEIPITISGATGANFPRRVGNGGHYYWFLGLPRVFESKLTGVVEAAYNATGTVKVTDVE